MRRKINLIFIIIFSMIIFLPYLFAHRDREGRASDMENRMLSAYPSFRLEDGTLNRNYPGEFEDWLNDNLRGRTLLVRANSELQYRLFGRIVKSDTMEGAPQWFFVNDADMIAEYQRLNLLSGEELDAYAEQMQGISDYLREKRIAFYYYQCFSKEEIYPEKYVEGINRLGAVSKADQIIGILQEKTDVKQILTKDYLTEHRDENIYYQFFDILHWNEKGSYYGYRLLMEELCKDFGNLPVLQEEDFAIREQESVTSLYGFAYPYVEYCPIYELKEPHAVEITEQTRDRWSFLHYVEHTHDFVNESCDNDLRILLVGDSFFRMFLKDQVAESFGETLSIDWLNIPILDKVVEEYQPDIVVLESAQSALGNTVELVGEADFVK